MNKKYYALFSLLIILAFIGYIIYDSATSGSGKESQPENAQEPELPDQWEISKDLLSTAGPLLSVTVSESGEIYLGGESYISCYNNKLLQKWSIKTNGKITALSVYGDTIFAASLETIYLFTLAGKLINEWGPYEANSIITSISANKDHVAFADAGIKRVFVLKKNGEVMSMVGQSDQTFIIPSPYFDVALSGNNTMFIANTGNRRIETWSSDGRFIKHFGHPGTAPEAFCGCCNPAHFAVIPQGFVTAEKGINRIKIVGPEGEFIEFVSSKNNFTPAFPLDVASADGQTIYAVNPEDSKLYVFKRK